MLVRLETFFDPAPAFALRSCLRAHGFFCKVFDFHVSATMWPGRQAIGLGVWVLETELNDCVALLDAIAKETQHRPYIPSRPWYVVLALGALSLWLWANFSAPLLLRHRMEDDPPDQKNR